MDTIRLQMKRHAILVQVALVGIAVLFLSFHFSRQLIDYDEATYAQVVVDTMHTGQVMDLYRSGNPWFEKPPLYMWLSMASVVGLGEHEFSFRLPSILAAILCCWLIYLLIMELTGDTLAAALGFLILLSSSPFLVYAREMRPDSSVIAAILAALYCFVVSWRREKFLVLVLPAIAVGFLFKSVIALLALPIILSYAAVYNTWRFLRSRYFWVGAFAALMVWAPWHIIETIHFGSVFWNDYMGRQIVTRTLSTLTGTNGIGDYLMLIGPWYIPWSIVLVVEIGILGSFAWKQRKNATVALLPVLLPSLIAVGIIVLFTAARTHLGPYIMPAFPFFALSIALVFSVISAIPRYSKMVCGVGVLGIVIGFFMCLVSISLKDAQVTPYSYDERVIGQMYRAQHMPQVPLYIFNWKATETLSYYGDTHAVSLMPSDASGRTLHGPFFLAISSETIPYLFLDGNGTTRYPGLTLMYAGHYFALVYGSQDFPLP